MSMIKYALLSSALALAACSDRTVPPPPAQPENAPENLVANAAHNYGPQFGDEQIIRGNVEIGTGISALALCSLQGAECSDVMTAAGGSNVCWMEFTENGRASMERYGGIERSTDKKSFWLEGVGRIARGPGKFGRRNSYSCLVQIDQVKAYFRQFEEIVPSERGKTVDSGIIPVPYEQ